MQVIRGAITANCNERDEILGKTKKLIAAIIEENDILLENILSIQFTATKELTAVYPAVAAREMGITEAALMCMQELFIENSLPNCIRVAITVDTPKKQSQAVAVYLDGAAVLRPDLAPFHFAVAIDGPAGSGKSSAAKEIAKRRKLIYIDTGAMYRAVGLYCQRKGISTEDESAVTNALNDIHLDFKLSGGEQTILLNGEDVTNAVRTQEAGKGASDVAVILTVRQKLLEIQRNLAKGADVVMDGRDIGTNVLPDACVKLYIDASVSERAKRRVCELTRLGEQADIQQVTKQIAKRDEADKSRVHNPLSLAKDAVYIDTSEMDLEAVVQNILNIIDEKLTTRRKSK